MASAGAGAYNGGLGACPQRGPGAEPLFAGSGGEAPLKLNVSEEYTDNFYVIVVSAKYV